MDFKQRIGFREDHHKDLVRFLEDNKIKYQGGDSGDIPIAVLEILESSRFWPEIKEYITKHNISEYTEGVYTKREMEQAEWFDIRSKWRWEYPQPESDFGYEHNITYSDKDYCEECGSGLLQIDSFRVKKHQTEKKKLFMLNWIADELFLTDNAKNILTNSKLKGFEFIDVVKPKAETRLENFNQLKVKKILPPGLIDQDNTIREHTKCKKCGNIQVEAFASNGMEKINMKDIDTIIDMLSWRNSETVQQEGIKSAMEVKHLDAFIMPYDGENKMDAWENCARILASKSDDALAPYAVKLVEWIYELMMPGAEIIFERLKNFSEAKESVIIAIIWCTKIAVAVKDNRWIASIAGLLDNEKIKAALQMKSY